MSKIINDQFYTKQSVADYCFQILKKYPELYQNRTILEPSAGTGSFLRTFTKNGILPENILAYDIDPKCKNVQKSDFLTVKLDKKNMIAVGNPPFERRSSLAIEFFNKCTLFCDTIAFIVPVQFRKYGVQSRLNNEFRLIEDVLLQPESFENNGKPLSVRCCFQIWTRNKNYNNLRILTKPDISDDDFTLYLYNNTPQALKFFDYDWDFAVPRQGYYDYSLRITDKAALNPRIQYMFFKGNTREITERLKSLDFDKLAKKNTTINGYGKADVVTEYRRIYKCL